MFLNLKNLHAAMKMLGLNPMEQEIVDLTNTTTMNGFIYFPDFCKIVLKRWREVDEEVFRQNMFKVTIIITRYTICINTPIPRPYAGRSHSQSYSELRDTKLMIISSPRRTSLT